MASEADEHERALAVEISFQRRQWDKLRELGEKMEKQACKVQDLERRLQEQVERSRSLEDALEAQRSEGQTATAVLAERCSEERDSRQNELHALRLVLKNLEGKCDELVREERDSRQSEMHSVRLSHKSLEGKCEELKEATRELPASIHKHQQELQTSREVLSRRHDDLHRDLGGRCKDLEKLIAEERAARAQELKSLQALLHSLQTVHDELERGSAREREARKQEHQDIRTSLERKFAEMVRETTKDLSKLIHSKHQESTDLHRENGTKCKEIFREVSEDREARARDHQGLKGALVELERRFAELLREMAEEVGEKHITMSARSAEVEKRCGQALKDLAVRVDDVEHNLSTHTHTFTSSKTYKCGPPRNGADLCVGTRIRSPRGGPAQPPDGMSTMSTVAGSEL